MVENTTRKVHKLTISLSEKAITELEKLTRAKELPKSTIIALALEQYYRKELDLLVK